MIIGEIAFGPFVLPFGDDCCDVTEVVLPKLLLAHLARDQLRIPGRYVLIIGQCTLQSRQVCLQFECLIVCGVRLQESRRRLGESLDRVTNRRRIFDTGRNVPRRQRLTVGLTHREERLLKGGFEDERRMRVRTASASTEQSGMRVHESVSGRLTLCTLRIFESQRIRTALGTLLPLTSSLSLPLHFPSVADRIANVDFRLECVIWLHSLILIDPLNVFEHRFQSNSISSARARVSVTSLLHFPIVVRDWSTRSMNVYCG